MIRPGELGPEFIPGDMFSSRLAGLIGTGYREQVSDKADNSSAGPLTVHAAPGALSSVVSIRENDNRQLLADH